jgi:type VI secretion system protein ImpH
VEEESDKEDHFLVTATLLGLYGPSSPLPTFYTEDLMDEASADESVTRAFIDIFNHRLFLLLVKSWAKYRPFLQLTEERRTQDINILFSLLGLFDAATRQDVPDSYGLLRYVGLFNQLPRSSSGLKSLLQDALGESPVQVVPCVARKAQIPRDQRLTLGVSNCFLGTNCFVGEEIDDRMGKFRLQIGPLKAEGFQGLLPGGRSCEKLAFLTKFYVTDPLEYDVELTLSEGEAQSVCLGHPRWSRLGWDTWVFTGKRMGEVRAVYHPGKIDGF